MADEPQQVDPRMATLLERATTPNQRALFSWLMQGIVALEAVDFGELEPADVASPASRR